MNYKLFKYVIFGVFCIMFQSCLLPKKLDKFFNKKPTLAAQKCIQYFPIKETTDTVTIIDSAILQAYEMEFVYLYSMLDSLLGEQVNDSIKKEIVTIFQEKKVPVIKYKYITKTIESTAKYQVLLDSMQSIELDLGAYIEGVTAEKELYGKKYKEASEKLDKVKGQRNKLYWWILLLLLLLFRKPLIRVANRLITKS
jgi:hypothetical protein